MGEALFCYGRRKMRKVKTLREVEGRTEQFENIARLQREYAKDLIISMDGAAWPGIVTSS